MGGGEGCRLSSALWVYHSRRGKGKGDGEEKGNMGLRGGVTPRPDEVHSICNCRGTYMHQVPL